MASRWILVCVNFETDRARIGGLGVGGCTTTGKAQNVGLNG